MLNADENLKRYLSDNRLLDDLSEAAERMGITCWLVGGALRDVVLGRPVTDVDLAATSDPTPLAREWARQQQAHWFWLDKQRRQSRVLLRYGKLECYFDFAPLRAATLDEDLALRDFTINALALPLIAPLSEQRLLDPLQGRKDLRDLRLRHCSDRSLSDDPLRILKGIRHCVTLGLQPATATAARMRELSGLLASSAAERKRNELGRIFAGGNLGAGLTLLEHCRLLPVLFGPPAGSFALPRVIAELSAFAAVLERWADREPLADLLEDSYDETINRRTLYLLALFLRHYRRDGSGIVLTEQLRFSRRAATVIEKLANLDFSRLARVATLPDRTRAKCVWLESLGPVAVDQLLFFAGVARPDYLSDAKLLQLLNVYSSAQIHERIPDLLSGRDIKRLLPAIEDRQIGSYQKRIKEAEITGEITSRKEAGKLLLAENSIDKN